MTDYCYTYSYIIGYIDIWLIAYNIILAHFIYGILTHFFNLFYINFITLLISGNLFNKHYYYLNIYSNIIETSIINEYY